MGLVGGLEGEGGFFRLVKEKRNKDMREAIRVWSILWLRRRVDYA
jgi:hypothetical protein